MQTYSNVSSVPLSLAVFLASDSYDHSSDEAVISATTLLKPLRQIILSSRVPDTESVADLVGMVASRMGSAIHDGIERAWVNNHAVAMTALGYPAGAIKKVLINPEPSALYDGCIPIYLERRAFKKVGRYTVSGKYDFVGDGRVEDFKTTSVWTAMKNVNDDKYIWQGSIYRWLNPEIITKDQMAIQFIFTDWAAARARSEPNYPQSRIQQRVLPLKSVAETGAFIERKLNQIDQYWDAEEESIPQCTDEDLWRSEAVFKYYKNPASTKRSTKNFDTKQEATLRFIEDGGVGIVKEQPGQVMACKYCAAFSACSQKDTLIAQGDLVL